MMYKKNWTGQIYTNKDRKKNIYDVFEPEQAWSTDKQKNCFSHTYMHLTFDVYFINFTVIC